MTDRYQQFARSNIGRLVVTRLGLPNPVPLRRYESGHPSLAGPVLLGGAGGRLLAPVARVLARMEAAIYARSEEQAGDVDVAAGAVTPYDPDLHSDLRLAVVVFDATGIRSSDRLRDLYDFFHPVIPRVMPSGRVVVLASPPEETGSIREATAQRAVEGFVRSVGKEVGRGATAQLVQVSAGAEDNIESTMRFLLSAKSAYVSGQVIRVGPGTVSEPADWDRPLVDKVALVTGAARGIGASIAATLARDGAHVVCLDLPAQGAALSEVANGIGGSTLQLDITHADAPQLLAKHLRQRHEGVDIVIHNAGITRDKTLARMRPEHWDLLMDINLGAQERIDDVLLGADVIRPGGRIVGLSSINGIAGQFGQTNYATSKAGVIGRVHAMAPAVAERQVTINAVAPGFIETLMTKAVPTVIREVGRRLNSMAQGGLPVDVAETIAWLASPASGGINGNVVRVCGQGWLGA